MRTEPQPDKPDDKSTISTPVTGAEIEREKIFYRELLESICQEGRKTRARRLAESGLMFWDQMQKEKSKRRRANETR